MPTKNYMIMDISETRKLDTISRTFILFVQTARDILRYVDARLYREAHSSLTQLIVLQVLSYQNEIMKPSEISAWTQTESHNITTLIRRMQRDGLVKSERDRRNRRIVNVELTDKGKETLARMMPTANKIIEETMMSITVDEAALLKKLLKTIRQNANIGLQAIR